MNQDKTVATVDPTDLMPEYRLAILYFVRLGFTLSTLWFGFYSVAIAIGLQLVGERLSVQDVSFWISLITFGIAAFAIVVVERKRRSSNGEATFARRSVIDLSQLEEAYKDDVEDGIAKLLRSSLDADGIHWTAVISTSATAGVNPRILHSEHILSDRKVNGLLRFRLDEQEPGNATRRGNEVFSDLALKIYHELSDINKSVEAFEGGNVKNLTIDPERGAIVVQRASDNHHLVCITMLQQNVEACQVKSRELLLQFKFITGVLEAEELRALQALV